MKYILTILMLVCSMSAISQTYSKDLEKAAKNGDIAAQRDLGISYLYGNGTKVNYEKAYEWLMRAGVNKDGAAQYHLGVMCEKHYINELRDFNVYMDSRIYRNLGGERSTEANYYVLIYELAYENGSKDAPRKLYEHYKKIGMPNRAVRWLKILAECGDKDSQFEYAKMLYSGNVKAENSFEDMIVKEVVLPLKESYLKGEISKEQIDSMFTEEGFKATFPQLQDNAEIIQAFVSAKAFFEKDIPGGNDALSYSKVQAKKWFEKAAAQGHVEAKDYLERLIADGF